MIMLTAAIILDATQYYFVGNYTSVFLYFGSIAFSFVVIGCILKKVETPKWVVYVYLLFLLVSGIWVWSGIIPFLPALAMMFIAYFQAVGNMRYIRIGTLLVALTWLANGIWSGSWTVCIGYVFQAVSAVVAIWRFRKAKGEG